MLAKLEDDAQFDLAIAQKKVEKKPSDKTKAAYYDALETYEFLSAELGDSSPAKVAAKARKVEAAAKAALQELAASLAKAVTLQDVVKYIAKASKNTSPLPALLGESRTDEGMTEVLAIVAEDPKMAELLATALLAAETEDAAAMAFASVREAAATAGTDDPEVLMRAKLDSAVARYVMGGELAMSKIKDVFNQAAAAATSDTGLTRALAAAKRSAEAKRVEITAALTEAVGEVAYDLTAAFASIDTALAAGSMSIGLNHARQSSMMEARDFEATLYASLASAEAEADVAALLVLAHDNAIAAEARLDAQLEVILDVARADAGLADRIAEAEALADEIRAAQFAAFEDASAGAELTGIGASTRVSIANIVARFQGQLVTAETADDVDQRLRKAEDDASLLLTQMNAALDAILETHGLDLTATTVAGEANAVALAHQLFDAVARDIDALAGQAQDAADQRKAAIQNGAADAALALYESTKAKATEAGAAQAALGHELDYYLGQAMAAETDEDKATADAKVTELEEQIAELELVKASATV